MNSRPRTDVVLVSLVGLFVALAAAFLLNLWGRTAPLPGIRLVGPWATNTTTVRTNLAELIRVGADVSLTDCYGCHEKDHPPPLRFDADHNLIVPEEHEDIVMRHGAHNRNNLCYNCHNEANLELLQTRDGRELKLHESTPLCGSCHGPTYRDWEGGAHGRTEGFWDRTLGAADRKPCVACHDPHSPKFPSQKPAPGPHPLRPTVRPALAEKENH